MTKQDKIKTGLSSIKLSMISYDGKTKHPHFLSPIDIKKILSYLHSQGVVIKVERELPQVTKRTTRLMGATFPEDDPWKGDEHLEPCPLCSQAGYVAVAPLIKEGG